MESPHPAPPPTQWRKKRPDTKIKEASPASVILQTDADTQTPSNKYANMYLNGSLIGLTWLLWAPITATPRDTAFVCWTADASKTRALTLPANAGLPFPLSSLLPPLLLFSPLKTTGTKSASQIQKWSGEMDLLSCSPPLSMLRAACSLSLSLSLSSFWKLFF